LWPLLALIPSLAGCPPAILSEQPLGDEIAVLNPEKVDGIWLAPDDDLIGIHVVDGKNGRFTYWRVRAYWPNGPLRCQPPSEKYRKCESENELVFEGTCTLRRQKLAGERQPFYFVEWRTPDQVYATTGVAVFDGESFAIAHAVIAWDRREGAWGPDLGKRRVDERLRELVAKHALPGRVDAKGVVVLGPLSPEHYKVILSQENGLFDWTAGGPLIKLPDELDPCKKQQELNPDTATKPNGKVDTSPDLKREPAGQEQPAR